MDLGEKLEKGIRRYPIQSAGSAFETWIPMLSTCETFIQRMKPEFPKSQ